MAPFFSHYIQILIWQIVPQKKKIKGGNQQWETNN